MPGPVVSDVGGLPQAVAVFDKDGDMDAGERSALIDALAGTYAGQGPTDLIVFSHGWNSSKEVSADLYQAFFGLFPPLLPATSRRIATVGVFWPSQMWSDEPIPNFHGGAAGLTNSAGDPVRALASSYAAAAGPTLEKLAALLEEQPDDPQALAKFQTHMRKLAGLEHHRIATEDSGALAMLHEDPQRLAQRFAAALEALAAPGPDEGGAASLGSGTSSTAVEAGAAAALAFDESPAAGFGSITHRIWDGAKEALRQLTYFQMKGRAGVVGEHGLGPLATALAARIPGLRVHLVGHSFGARLVSYTLRGVAEHGSPIASLTLVQGAFSHYAFAPKLPQDPSRGGALAGQESRVSGPIVACFSSHDSAVGTFYPVASMASRDDASGVSETMLRWGGMGHDGAQEVGAAATTMLPSGTAYNFGPGFTNVDGSAIVREGGAPAGAHSDIIHPEVAWVVAAAGGLSC